MTVIEMQGRLIALGWQFQEHVFNDGGHGNCYLQISKSKNPHVFGLYPLDEVTREDRKSVLGWGRFQRDHAWAQAMNHVFRMEGEQADAQT